MKRESFGSGKAADSACEGVKKKRQREVKMSWWESRSWRREKRKRSRKRRIAAKEDERNEIEFLLGENVERLNDSETVSAAAAMMKMKMKMMTKMVCVKTL